MAGFDFHDLIICVILLIIFEFFNRPRSPAQIFHVVFIILPVQVSNRNPLPLAKNVKVSNKKSPKFNADKGGLKKSTKRVQTSKKIAFPKETINSNTESQETPTEIFRPNATPERFLNSFESACPADINENDEEEASISKAKKDTAISAKKRPVTTHTKTSEDISTPQNFLTSAETKPTLTNSRISKSKTERIRLSSPRGRKFKSNSEEIRVRSPSVCKTDLNISTSNLDSKSKADNKRNKRSKSVANRREANVKGNVESSLKKNKVRSSSASPSPCRLPTKLFDNITSSSEPKDKKLDLHGYIVEEAIYKFHKFYQKMLHKYQTENCEEDDRYIYVVTGRGNGCPDGIPKIKPEIQNILIKMKIRHNWLNDGGLVMIDFCGQHEEMDLMELRKLTRMNRPRRKDKKKKGRNRNKGGKHDLKF